MKSHFPQRIACALVLLAAAVPAWAGAAEAGRGPLTGTDRALFEVFLKRARLVEKSGQYGEVALELATAERLLARRDAGLARELAARWLDAAHGYTFSYPERNAQERGAFLSMARACLARAARLDPACYGRAREDLLALENRESELALAREDRDALRRSRERLRSLRERDGAQDYQERLLRIKEKERYRADEGTRQLLEDLDAAFGKALELYRREENKLARETWGPLLKIVERMLAEVPNPPGSKFLYDVIVKHGANREVSEVLRFRKGRGR